MLSRLFIQTFIWIALMAALLFVPAGTTAWPEAWIYLGIIGGIGAAAGVWFARRDPGLLRERLASPLQTGQPAWDKAILLLFFTLYLASFVVMGLDAVRSCPYWSRLQAPPASWRPTRSSGASWLRILSLRRSSGYRRSEAKGS
jgi:hypothetical protein